MSGAYTDQLLTEVIYQDGTAVAKVGGALGGGLNFKAPLTATPNGSTGNVDVTATPTVAFDPSMVGTSLSVDGSSDVPPIPLWVNGTGGSVTITGAALWPGQDVAADGTNYETVALIVYPTTNLTSGAGATRTITTASVSWVHQTPITFGGSALTIPAGGTLAINCTRTGTGANLGFFTVRMG